MNSAPLALAAAIALVVGLVTVGRWLLVNDSAADRLVNLALSWETGALLVYIVVAACSRPDLGQRLFIGVGALVMTNCLGFARLLDGADPRAVWERQRRYDRVGAALGVAALLCAAAEEFGLHLQRFIDWEPILWATGQVVGIWIGLLFLRVCLRELSGFTSAREKLTYLMLLLLGFNACATGLLTFVRLASGTPPVEQGTVTAVAAFISVGLLAILVGTPLFEALLVRANLDLEGRQCRRLQPLWRDLTAAVPEVVLPADRPRRSASRLYRMTVEIQDALLHLKQFTPDSGAVEDVSAYALHIAKAIHLRQQGTPILNPATSIHLPAHDRATELRNLLALSRAWPRARAVAASRVTASQG
ncbi:MAB_1171c family putative transporter [Nocardia sp. NPDC049149]|uniref:MAB_1171c family putative transporter n=1 Tax=Nocardia sp. NPDC049149 TaxID=3364315 RepID=UPI003722A204